MKKGLKWLLKTLFAIFVFLNVVVIFHAYKFTHYYEPGEVAIKPKESKTGWDKAGDLLFGFDALKQQNTPPDTAYEKVVLTTNKGIDIEAWLIKADSAIGTVALFHGHGGKKSSLLPEAAYLRSLGYNSFLVDFRAHGGSGGNTCTIGYNEVEEVKLAYDFLVKKGESNIVLYGISMGASTITKAIRDYGIEPSKIILDMPFGSLESAVEGRLKIMKLPPQPLGTLLTFWGGTIRGFWAFDHDPSEYAKAIKAPVLLQWGRLDPRVTEAETMALYNNISTSKKMVVYEQSAHESFCKKENKKWAGAIKAFLEQ
jgi:alpha-beta hydrolase superfamily lysophospholipase